MAVVPTPENGRGADKNPSNHPSAGIFINEIEKSLNFSVPPVAAQRLHEIACEFDRRITKPGGVTLTDITEVFAALNLQLRHNHGKGFEAELCEVALAGKPAGRILFLAAAPGEGLPSRTHPEITISLGGELRFRTLADGPVQTHTNQDHVLTEDAKTRRQYLLQEKIWYGFSLNFEAATATSEVVYTCPTQCPQFAEAVRASLRIASSPESVSNKEIEKLAGDLERVRLLALGLMEKSKFSTEIVDLLQCAVALERVVNTYLLETKELVASENETRVNAQRLKETIGEMFKQISQAENAPPELRDLVKNLPGMRVKIPEQITRQNAIRLRRLGSELTGAASIFVFAASTIKAINQY